MAQLEPLPFVVLDALEAALVEDPEWRRGATWGTPREGHPEGAVVNHVAEVLENVAMLCRRHPLEALDRQRLRIAALVHDTFKHRVDPHRPASGENHHAMIARRWLERFSDDGVLLDLVELHDEAHNAHGHIRRKGDHEKAERRLARLVDRMGPHLDLYHLFFTADNETGYKYQDDLRWFEAQTGRHPRLRAA